MTLSLKLEGGHVFHKRISWRSSFKSHYTERRELQSLLEFYLKMDDSESVFLTGHSYVMLLKACIELETIETGLRVHADVARIGLLERNVFVGSSLVDMYAKFGLMVKAKETLDILLNRNVVAWNALITGYADSGYCQEVLGCFVQMKYDGIIPDTISYVGFLRACSGLGAAITGQEIHDELVRKGLLEGDVFLGSALVDMYAKLDMLMEAKEVLENIPLRNAVSWNALISGYMENGHSKEVLIYLEMMKIEGIAPSPVTFIYGLKACNDVETVDKLYVEIAKKGLLEEDVMLSSTLVGAYAKIGMLTKSQDVFDNVIAHNVVLWNSLIAGYVEHGHGDEALACFEEMKRVGYSPDVVTLIFGLKACSITGAVVMGEGMHLEIAKKGLERDHLLNSTLVHMYAKCGFAIRAQDVFDKMSHQNVVLWTALISGYAEFGHNQEAFNCFEQMCVEDIVPNTVTFICSLKACESIGSIAKGQKMHVEITKQGIEMDSTIGSALIDMYARFMMLTEAKGSFENIINRDIFSWTALMRAYVECEHSEEAVESFELLQLDGISPDAFTYIFSIKACVNIGATKTAAEMHVEIVKKGIEKELLVSNALVDMYAKYGSLESALLMFEKLPVQDVISWNTVITALVDFEHNDDLINFLERMRCAGISPDPVAFISGLMACTNVGAEAKGQEIHVEVTKKGLEREILIGNSLVDFYVKCGSCATAKYVFENLHHWTVVTWNSLVIGYTQLGESDNVIKTFDTMLRADAEPDLVTFLNVLNACNHAGLIDEGQCYFEAMIKDFNLFPASEHYNCMVDLLGRAGHIDKALAMVTKIPMHAGVFAWQTLLAACRKWRNVDIARIAFENVVYLDEMDISTCICMYNIYVEAAMQDDANKLEKIRARLHQSMKSQGQSLLDIIDQIQNDVL